jgi:hypothetical protein
LRNEAVQRSNAIQERINETDAVPNDFLDELREHADWYRSEGPYNMIIVEGLSRFREVRSINTEISLLVETELRQRLLYIEYLETDDDDTYDESDRLRLSTKKMGDQIVDAVEDLRAEYGL